MSYKRISPQPVVEGGTGAQTFTQHSVLLGQNTSAITALGAATNGQLAIGSTGADPVLAVPSNGTSISWTAGAGTLTAEITGTTQYAVQVGSAAGGISSISVGSTGDVLIGSTGANPAFGSIGVNAGFTAYAPVCGGTTSLTAWQSASTGLSTAGYVLTSTGAASLPTWQIPAVLGNSVYYFTNTASSVATYLQQTASTYSPKTTLPFTSLAGGDTTLQNWITNAGIPNVNFLPSGSYVFHVHASKPSGTKTAVLYAEIWESSALGADIHLIGTTGNTAALGATEIEYLVDFSLGSPYVMASTASRITTRVHAVVSGGGSAPAVDIFVGGEADSHIEIPASAVDVTNFVPYTGAIKNVDVTPYGLTASTLTVPALTAHGVVIAEGASAFTATAVGTNGQVLTGVTGADPIWAAPSGGGTAWSVISADQTAVVGQGYFCNKAGTLSLLLPATSAVGDTFEVCNINNASGLTITQGTGQQIFIGNTSTTLTSGTLSSTALGDSLRLVCSVTNATWHAVSGWGNWTPL